MGKCGSGCNNRGTITIHEFGVTAGGTGFVHTASTASTGRDEKYWCPKKCIANVDSSFFGPAKTCAGSVDSAGDCCIATGVAEGSNCETKAI